jgi:hypothetical protein
VTLKRYPETYLEICTCSLRLTERSFSVLTKYLHLRAIELDKGGRLTSFASRNRESALSCLACRCDDSVAQRDALMSLKTERTIEDCASGLSCSTCSSKLVISRIATGVFKKLNHLLPIPWLRWLGTM